MAVEVRGARPGETNYNSTDFFTFGHMLWGTIMGAAGATATQALVTSIAWEAVEPALKRQFPQAFPSHTIDTMQNKVGDTAYWMAGWLLGYAMRAQVDE